MPLYEYRCEPCDRTFEALVRTPDDAPSCPECGTDRVRKQFSVPAAPQGGSGPRPAALPMAAPGCGAPMCCGGGCNLG
jgi:putative FmdB family regulatory protein